MTIQNPFSGRVIFDHLPKTAGMAVRDWLANVLGTSCVTTNLMSGQHRHLRKVYGDYSVIVAHLTFSGEGLDPRYRYFTCFREPLDRAISWLYFVINNHDEAQLGLLWQQAERFVKTEGTADSELTNNISNPYVEHFSSVNYVDERPRSDADKLAAAISAIEQYDVWGLFLNFWKM